MRLCASHRVLLGKDHGKLLFPLRSTNIYMVVYKFITMELFLLNNSNNGKIIITELEFFFEYLIYR